MNLEILKKAARMSEPDPAVTKLVFALTYTFLIYDI